MKVEITNSELQTAKRAGLAMSKYTDPTRHRTDKTHTNTQVSMLGRLGELAAAKATNGRLNWVEGEGDGGIDLWIGDTSAAVKFNHLHYGMLMIEPYPDNKWHDLRTDIAILINGWCEKDACHCQKQMNSKGTIHVTLTGWIKSERFKTEAELNDYGHGPRYTMPQRSLEPASTVPKVPFRF